jgi:superfamily II DNA/RNA helicase
MGRSQIEEDPKLDTILNYLEHHGFAEKGCILFSQYFDTAWYVGEKIVAAYPDQQIGLYAGSGKSGIWIEGSFHRREREEIKAEVKDRSIRLLIGTDAAAEGLNLQSLGTLINIDLPWNPTRLEQRKGRIQRIGQTRDTIEILNLRYKDSVEDKVHERLSSRLEAIHQLFGQIPEVLQNVWITAAIDNLEEAEKYIDNYQKDAKNPFQGRYEQMDGVPQDWETWKEVVNKHEKLAELRKGWKI